MSYFLLSLLSVSLLVPHLQIQLQAESYKEWMRSHGLREHIHDHKGDADRDGVCNLVEYVMGTSPNQASNYNLNPEVKFGKLHIRHPKKVDIEEMDVEYVWSKDLVNYQSSGEAAPDGTIAIINEEVTEADFNEVSAEVIEGQADSIYLKMVVTPTAIVSWGSSRSVGGALFANASTISLVDDQLNTLSGPISVGYDPYGVWGFAGIDEQIQDVTFLGVPLILIDTLDGSQGVVSSSTWLPLVSEVTPTPPPVNDYNLDSDDTESTIIDWAPFYNNLNRVVVTNTGGIGGSGVSIYVVPETVIEPEPEPEPEPDPPFFWVNPVTDNCPICVFKSFGGTVAVKNNYIFQTTKWGSEPAEDWGGFLYKEVNNEFPLTFGSGGSIQFSAGLYPSAQMGDVEIYFLLGRDNYPDIEPYYVTERVTLTMTGVTDYTITIPPQWEREFNALALYIVQRDQPITLTNVQFVTTPLVAEPEPEPEPGPDPIIYEIAYQIAELREVVSLAYDSVLDLYYEYPEIYSEINKMERRIRKTYRVVRKLSNLDLETLEPRGFKKVANSIRKAEYKINHVIDKLMSISEPSPIEWLFSDLLFRKWDFYGHHFWKKKFFHWEDDYNPYEFDELLEHLYNALSIADEINTLLHIYLETLAFHNEHLSNRPYEYPSIYLPPEFGAALGDTLSVDLEIPEFDYEAYTDYNEDEYETWHDDWFDDDED
jgi:hypothetical protein